MCGRILGSNNEAAKVDNFAKKVTLNNTQDNPINVDEQPRALGRQR